MTRENELRNAIIFYGKKLVEDKLIQATWGNISARLNDEYYLITPSGIDYFKITPNEIVKVKISDFSYEGAIKPSSERRMHGLIYQQRSDICAIVHTHSSNLQIFASCHVGLSINGEIIYPCSKYAVSGSKKLAKNVAKAIKNYDGVIIANHGFVVGDKSLEEAYNKALNAEKKAGECLHE